MSVFRATIWTGLGAAVVLGSALAACSGEGGEGGDAGAAAPASSQGGAASGGEGDEAGPAPAPTTGGEGEGGEGGSAAAGGERGAAAAYAAAPAESRRALRLAQLGGVFQAAQAVGATEGPEAAAALAGQGLLEVFDPAKAELAGAGLDEAVLRKAAQTGDPGDLKAAMASVDAAGKQAGGEPAAVARGLSSLAVGLLREAMAGGAVDPTEYQHSYAAALALRSLAQSQGELAPAKADIDRFVRLWPGPAAPTQPPALPPVQAQASRVELALSGV